MVTVPSRPRGEPIATTCWPTVSSEDFPIRAGVASVTPSVWITATSAPGSRPTMVAGALRPSWNVTVMEPPSAASATTWLLVMITPSLVRTMPDPVPEPAWPVKAMETTLGSTAAETASTPEALTPLGTSGAAAAAGVVVEASRVATVAPTAPPMLPATSAAATTAAAVRPPRRGSGAGVGVGAGAACEPVADSKGGTNVVSEEGVRVSMAPF